MFASSQGAENVREFAFAHLQWLGLWYALQLKKGYLNPVAFKGFTFYRQPQVVCQCSLRRSGFAPCWFTCWVQPCWITGVWRGVHAHSPKFDEGVQCRGPGSCMILKYCVVIGDCLKQSWLSGDTILFACELQRKGQALKNRLLRHMCHACDMLRLSQGSSHLQARRDVSTILPSRSWRMIGRPAQSCARTGKVALAFLVHKIVKVWILQARQREEARHSQT